MTSHFDYSVWETIEFPNLQLVSLKDRRTGFIVHTVVPNDQVQVSALQAYSGARFSRNPLGTLAIFQEIVDKSIDSEKRLVNIANYGHASVAEMTGFIPIYVDNTPDSIAVLIFNESSFGSGQHGSTRYINFGDITPVELRDYLDADREYASLPIDIFTQTNGEYLFVNSKFIEYQKRINDLFNSWYTKIYDAFSHHFQVDLSDKKQVDALEARTLDTVRAFLPKGLFLKTNFLWMTQAREWSRIIAFLTARENPHQRYLGEQIKALLAPLATDIEGLGYNPEISGILKYTEADERFGSSFSKLREFADRNNLKRYLIPGFETIKAQEVDLLCQSNLISQGEMVAIQSLHYLDPTAAPFQLLYFIRTLNDAQKLELSHIIYGGFDCYNQMGNNAKTGGLSFHLTVAHSEMRDFVRHRVWGRWVPQVYNEQNYFDSHNAGYILAEYLNLPEFYDLKLDFMKDVESVITLRDEFTDLVRDIDWFPHFVLFQMDLFCTATCLWMHGSPKDVSYMTDRRRRPGGQINYRIVASDMAQLVSQSEPLLAGLAISSPRPDPNSREEFLDRS